MSEQCPLAGGLGFREVPETCFEQCAELWNLAVSSQSTHEEYDAYPESIIPNTGQQCSHECDTEYGSDGLQAPNASALRLYTLVDLCICCKQEIGEQSFRFNCPYNTID